jgi:hypothetical protein
MNAAVAYYLAGYELSTPGSPPPRPPRGGGEARGLIAVLVAAVVVLASALGAIAF